MRALKQETQEEKCVGKTHSFCGFSLTLTLLAPPQRSWYQICEGFFPQQAILSETSTGYPAIQLNSDIN